MSSSSSIQCRLESVILTLPSSVRHKLWHLLDPYSMLCLGRTSRTLCRITWSDDAYWRYMYIEQFLGQDHAGTGENVDEREEIWLIRMKMIWPTLIQTDHPILSLSSWFGAFAWRARIRQHWSTVTPTRYTIPIPKIDQASNTIPTSSISITPLINSSQHFVVAGSRAFWIQSRPLPFTLELTLEGLDERVDKIPIKPQEDWEWAVAQVDIKPTASSESRTPLHYLVAWSIPAHPPTNETSDHPISIAPHVVFSLRNNKSPCTRHGPWVIATQMHASQGTVQPLLIHLPTGTVHTGSSMHARCSEYQIQTWSDAAISWQHPPVTTKTTPSIVYFNVALSRDPNLPGLVWKQMRYTLGDQQEELLQQGYIPYHIAPINGRSIWLYRVDHVSMLVRFGTFGRAMPVVALLKAQSKTQPAGQQYTWLCSMNPAMFIPYPSQHTFLVLSRDNRLLSISLKDGSLCHTVKLRARSHLTPIFASCVLLTQQSFSQEEIKDACLIEDMWSTSSQSSNKLISLIDMTSKSSHIKNIAHIPSSIDTTPILYANDSQLCWPHFDMHGNVDKLIIFDFAH
jgi:hypothetical protein